ncbi:AMP-binding protein [Methyloversatilis thermotolerans]|uniref:AMP-binding protein n=1 Tax=Methyloversatilis thermotolerans TaxID=1346290 RepID=UPI0022B65D76|nr:AMP-binding protein [Methyloversatilis thermotolerans]
MQVGGRPQTLAGLLRWRAAMQPDREAFTFLGDVRTEQISYRALAERSEAIACALASVAGPGDRVVLACPPGADFVAGFFACMLAGCVAVPVQPPGRRADAARWRTLVSAAAPTALLSAGAALQAVTALAAGGVALIDVAAPASARCALPDAPAADAIALLQYTSGSTREPRGVQVSHGNLMYNLGQIERRFAHDADSRGVIWLPPFHDMGLIGGILQPVYAGFPVTLMSPAGFLRRPLRWLEAIQEFAATTSGGPNFAYEYCLRRIAPEDRRRLDLSSWQVAFCGAETVRAGTLERFSDAFAPAGFRRNAFLPCYGLAEATLLATSARAGQGAHLLAVDPVALREHEVRPARGDAARTLVGCGVPADGSELIIVDPDTKSRLPADRIGEIWLRGPGVCAGYRGGEAMPDWPFAARTADGDGPWLRTGDLGVLADHQLFVTGRLRDVLVIRGANHAPQDIEATAEAAHDLVMVGGCAAFAVEVDGEEVAVLAAELVRGGGDGAPLADVASAIRRAVSETHGLQLHAVRLLRSGSLPRTPSGKVQRARARALFEAQALQALHADAAATAPDEASSARADALVTWLRDYAPGIDSRLMDERRSLSPPVLLDFGNRGLLGLQVPPELGGLGLGHRDTLRVIEQIAAIDSTLGLFVGLSNVLGIRPILKHGRPALRERMLPLLAGGRELAAFALTEAGAGSHPHAMEAVARPRPGGGWTLHGRKVWSGSAAWASVINVFVRQCDGEGHPLGITAFAVPRGRPGLRQGPEALTMGMRAMVQNSVLLDGVPVDEQDMLGGEGEGMAVAQDAMMYGRLVIAAACTGGIKRCAQLMLRYAGRRQVAGGRLLDLPLTRERLAALCAMADALSLFVSGIAGRLDAGETLPEELYAAAKILAPELYWQAIDHLLQCLGGRGYIEPNLAPQMMRDARVLRVFEGPTETLAAWLGARALRQPEALRDWCAHSVADGRAIGALHELADRAALQPATSRQAGCAVGTAIAWQLLRAASGPAADAVTRAWLDACVDAAMSSARAAFDADMPDAGDLARRVHAYAEDIGDIEADVAGEEHAHDRLLRRDPSVGLAEGQALAAPAVRSGITQRAAAAADDGAREVADWLRDWLARQLGVPAQDIDAHRAFADYGVDSVMAVELVQDLEQAFALAAPLDATLAWNHPTIAAASARIASLRRSRDAARPAEALDALDDEALARLLEAELAASSASR